MYVHMNDADTIKSSKRSNGNGTGNDEIEKIICTSENEAE